MERHIMNTEEWTLEKEIELQKIRDTEWSCNMSKKIKMNNSRISNDDVWNDEDWRSYVGEFI